jgi:hypothetical protein
MKKVWVVCQDFLFPATNGAKREVLNRISGVSASSIAMDEERRSKSIDMKGASHGHRRQNLLLIHEE